MSFVVAAYKSVLQISTLRKLRIRSDLIAQNIFTQIKYNLHVNNSANSENVKFSFQFYESLK